MFRFWVISANDFSSDGTNLLKFEIEALEQHKPPSVQLAVTPAVFTLLTQFYAKFEDLELIVCCGHFAIRCTFFWAIISESDSRRTCPVAYRWADTEIMTFQLQYKSITPSRSSEVYWWFFSPWLTADIPCVLWKVIHNPEAGLCCG